MAAKSSPGGFVVATVTNPGSFMAIDYNASYRERLTSLLPGLDIA